MAIVYPYSLAYLADTLCIVEATWDIRRNDEMSGSGDGRIWQAELAPPLWTASIALAPSDYDSAKQIAAKIRKLHGSQEAFFLYDPVSKYPQYDPTGAILGSATPTILAINTDTRAEIALQGLPANYVMTIGDKIQIVYGSNPVHNAFIEVSETSPANSSGSTNEFGIFPFLPTGITTGMQVILKKPACKMILAPGTHSPGTNAGRIAAGAKFETVQRK